MSEKQKQTLDKHDHQIRADEALALARELPPGSERNQAALKHAGLLRREADARGVVFARLGRPPR
jgi:hypothetical protein